MMDTSRLRWKWHDLKWWFLHRFHPRHRYHVIKTGLEPGWHDSDFMMDHLIGKLLIDFVEKEKPFDHFVTDGPESCHPKEWAEIQKLYDYFKTYPDDDTGFDNYEERTAKLIEVVSLRKMLWT